PGCRFFVFLHEIRRHPLLTERSAFALVGTRYYLKKGKTMIAHSKVCVKTPSSSLSAMPSVTSQDVELVGVSMMPIMLEHMLDLLQDIASFADAGQRGYTSRRLRDLLSQCRRRAGTAQVVLYHLQQILRAIYEVYQSAGTGETSACQACQATGLVRP